MTPTLEVGGMRRFFNDRICRELEAIAEQAYLFHSISVRFHRVLLPRWSDRDSPSA